MLLSPVGGQRHKRHTFPFRQTSVGLTKKHVMFQVKQTCRLTVCEILPLSMGDPRITECPLGTRKSSLQTGTRSIQPFLHRDAELTGRQADIAIVGNNSLHLTHSMQPKVSTFRIRVKALNTMSSTMGRDDSWPASPDVWTTVKHPSLMFRRANCRNRAAGRESNGIF